MPTLIAGIAAGKKAVDIGLMGVRAWKAYRAQPDSIGRLLVLLHTDFGKACDLGRDSFYSWRARDDLRDALERVLAGELKGRETEVAHVAALAARPSRLPDSATVERKLATVTTDERTATDDPSRAAALREDRRCRWRRPGVSYEGSTRVLQRGGC